MNKPSSPRSDSEASRPRPDPTARQPGTVLDRWSITPEKLTLLVDANPGLRGVLFWHVTELKLREFFDAHPDITRSADYSEYNRVIEYRRRRCSVEVKTVLEDSIEKKGSKFSGVAQADASDRRTLTLPGGRRLKTSLLLRGQFDLLAVNCFAFENKWRFAFALGSDLPASRYHGYTPAERKALIASLIPVAWPPRPPFVEDPHPLLERLARTRSREP